jgi:hypothetical protein
MEEVVVRRVDEGPGSYSIVGAGRSVSDCNARGSHRQYKRHVRQGRVTVAGKLSDDLAPGTLNSILKQPGLKEQL